jgi:hypothetical protein
MSLRIRRILEKLSRGEISVKEAEDKLKLFSLKSVARLARLDLGRETRRNVPEIIFAEGKPPKLLLAIVVEALKREDRVIVARVSSEQLKKMKKLESKVKLEYLEDARILVARRKNFKPEKLGGKVAIFTAGTADVPVAREAEVVAREMGCEVYTAYDVGIAGIHRLVKPLKEALTWGADVFIVVAGMEGALPSVVSSLVDVPVIGVPTSVGYGFGGRGEAALMSMLQSCSLGLAVVNIDNGVGAGACAALIANMASLGRRKD